MTSPRVPLLDDHAHPFPLEPDVLDLGSLSLSTDPASAGRRRAAAPSRLMLELLRGRLAALLQCDPDEVGDARAEAARDWPSYVRRLFANAGIGGMLLDGGPQLLMPSEIAAYAETAGVPTWPLFRLEAVIDPLLDEGVDGPSIAAAVSQLVSSAASAAAGLKTVVAYRTGLAVDPAVTAEEAFRSVESAAPVRQRAKPLRDYLLREVFAQCADVDLPIQIHTGFGDSDLRLATANPALLDDVLRTPEGAAAKVVLIHAGHPWQDELAYLTLVRSNLWAEFSLVNLFAPLTTADRLIRILDVAPVDRVLFGTDGHGSPETHWFAACALRDAWTEVRSRLSSIARASWLDDAEQQVWRDNAAGLYRISGG